MSPVFSFIGLGLLAVMAAWLEVPRLLKAGQTGELWAFIAVGAIAFTLLALVTASISFAPLGDVLALHVKPYIDPIIQPPPQ